MDWESFLELIRNSNEKDIKFLIPSLIMIHLIDFGWYGQHSRWRYCYRF